jgi:hypothetical protein
MATRPLDLGWMVRRWQRAGTLGRYGELIENGMVERLADRNSGYREAGVLLSPDQLRTGAEALAAACVFSNCESVALSEQEDLEGCVNPQGALPNWRPNEVERLLGTALFDEASYGRVKFHHRVVREYLAACWIRGRLSEGLPLMRALELFVKQSFGQEVLLDSLRGTLGWLASIHAPVRAHVIRSHPDILLFEGSPDDLGTEEIVEALSGFLQKLQTRGSVRSKTFLRPGQEVADDSARRLAPLVPPTVLAKSLKRYECLPQAARYLLLLIKFAAARECAAAVREVYESKEVHESLAVLIIDVLGNIGTSADRDLLASDLMSSRSRSFEATVAALVTCGVNRFPVATLHSVLMREWKGVEPWTIATHVSKELLRAADLTEAVKWLEVLELLLPAALLDPNEDRWMRAGKLRGWALDAAPEWLLCAIQNLGSGNAAIPAQILSVARTVARLRCGRQVEPRKLTELRLAIAGRPPLRRSIALAIGLGWRGGVYREFIVDPWLVAYGVEDLADTLTDAGRMDQSPEEATFWFQLALGLAVNHAKGSTRRDALQRLSLGLRESWRKSTILAERRARGRHVRDLRSSNAARREEKCRLTAEKQATQRDLLGKLESIRSAANPNILGSLLEKSFPGFFGHRFVPPRFERVRLDFGPEIAAALEDGLLRFWRECDATFPWWNSPYHLPRPACLALAGLQLTLDRGADLSEFGDKDFAQLIRLSVWSGAIETTDLVNAKPEAAFKALAPWFLDELRALRGSERPATTYLLTAPETLLHRALSFALTALATDESIAPECVQEIFEAAAQHSVELRERAAACAKGWLEQFHAREPTRFPYYRLRALAAVDFAQMCQWIREHRSEVQQHGTECIKLLLAELGGSSWYAREWRTPADLAGVVDLFDWIDPYFIEHNAAERASKNELRKLCVERIGLFSGAAAHRALQTLMQRRDCDELKALLDETIRAHAVAEAEACSSIAADELIELDRRYCREPRTVNDLFHQVLARLCEIKEAVEKGPFSERSLLFPGIPEKRIQLWLASRLSDTPLRRFTPRFVVHREPVVDRDDRTDIEVSGRPGKVCIEIKPIDSMRNYSAPKLAETLREQLAGQYLRGGNSKHGILVLLRLDHKEWEIPGQNGRKGFAELMHFLEDERLKVLRERPDVEALEIVSIDCTSG